jgi:hypothetical protein
VSVEGCEVGVIGHRGFSCGQAEWQLLEALAGEALAEQELEEGFNPLLEEALATGEELEVEAANPFLADEDETESEEELPSLEDEG